MRTRRCLHRALQEQAIEGRGDCIRTMFQIDLELAGTGLLHDRVDKKTLDLANTVDVVDEGSKDS